jgi:hypothetical protein
MEAFALAVFVIMVLCVVGEVWKNLSTPNLRCRLVGHGIRINDGWAYCERCRWREPVPPLPEGS